MDKEMQAKCDLLGIRINFFINHNARNGAWTLMLPNGATVRGPHGDFCFVSPEAALQFYVDNTHDDT